MTDQFDDCKDFQYFITLARGCSQGQFGANWECIANLLQLEREQPYGHRSEQYLKSLAEVKFYMTAAARFASKRDDLKNQDRDQLNNFIHKIDIASNGRKLLMICSRGRLLFESHEKEDLK